MTNDSGTVTQTYQYDAFGNQLNANPADTNPIRYCGEYYDTETGTYYLRARYYSPTLGRFTQRDPHWNTGNMLYGDDPVTMSRGILNSGAYYVPSMLAVRQSGNLYVYCINNPVLFADNAGEFANTVFGALFGAVNGGIGAALMKKDITNAMISGAIGGAVAGFGLDTGGLGWVVAFAALGGFSGNVADQMLNGTRWEDVKWNNAGISAVVSGFFGTGTYSIDKLMKSAFSTYIPQGSNLLYQLMDSLKYSIKELDKIVFAQFLTNAFLESPKWVIDVTIGKAKGELG